jgi:N-acetylglucosamine-6-phosphate deacetylase
MKCIGKDAVTGACVEVTGDKVIQSVEELIAPPEHAPMLAPGFVDIQINGFGGVDYNDPAAPIEAIGRSLEKIFSTGATRVFPTVITGGPDDMAGALRNLAKARATLPHGRALEAFHVEGPYICPDDGPRGAHPKRWVRPPDFDEYRRWQEAAEGLVRLITLSPEWPQAPAFVERVVRDGVVVSIGHTAATGAQIRAVVDAGATLSTHLGNGAHRELTRHPNYIWDQLAEDRLSASFICDGIHLGDNFMKAAMRAKGLERCVLVTDAVMPAMCEPGPYMLGEVEVELKPDQSVVLRGGNRLAGSSLRMDRGINVLMQHVGLSLAESVTLSTRNPARVGRVAGRLRGLQPGERNDLVEFDFDSTARAIRVRRTWLDGEQVYSAGV